MTLQYNKDNFPDIDTVHNSINRIYTDDIKEVHSILFFAEDLLVRLCEKSEFPLRKLKRQILLRENKQKPRFRDSLPIMRVFFAIMLFHKGAGTVRTAWAIHRNHSTVVHSMPQKKGLKAVRFSRKERALYKFVLPLVDLTPFDFGNKEDSVELQFLGIIHSLKMKWSFDMFFQLARDWVVQKKKIASIKFLSKSRKLEYVTSRMLLAAILYMFLKKGFKKHVFSLKNIESLFQGGDRDVSHYNVLHMIKNHKEIMESRSSDEYHKNHRSLFYKAVKKFYSLGEANGYFLDPSIVIVNFHDIKNDILAPEDRDLMFDAVSKSVVV